MTHIVALFEHQSRAPGRKWGLPQPQSSSQPAQWQLVDGTPCASKDEFGLNEEAIEWITEWTLVTTPDAHGPTDAAGWAYSDAWPATVWHEAVFEGACVRRRQWQRRRAKHRRANTSPHVAVLPSQEARRLTSNAQAGQRRLTLGRRRQPTTPTPGDSALLLLSGPSAVANVLQPVPIGPDATGMVSTPNLTRVQPIDVPRLSPSSSSSAGASPSGSSSPTDRSTSLPAPTRMLSARRKGAKKNSDPSHDDGQGPPVSSSYASNKTRLLGDVTSKKGHRFRNRVMSIRRPAKEEATRNKIMRCRLLIALCVSERSFLDSLYELQELCERANQAPTTTSTTTTTTHPASDADSLALSPSLLHALDMGPRPMLASPRPCSVGIAPSPRHTEHAVNVLVRQVFGDKMHSLVTFHRNQLLQSLESRLLNMVKYESDILGPLCDILANAFDAVYGDLVSHCLGEGRTPLGWENIMPPVAWAPWKRLLDYQVFLREMLKALPQSSPEYTVLFDVTVKAQTVCVIITKALHFLEPDLCPLDPDPSVLMKSASRSLSFIYDDVYCKTVGQSLDACWPLELVWVASRVHKASAADLAALRSKDGMTSVADMSSELRSIEAFQEEEDGMDGMSKSVVSVRVFTPISSTELTTVDGTSFLNLLRQAIGKRLRRHDLLVDRGGGKKERRLRVVLPGRGTYVGSMRRALFEGDGHLDAPSFKYDGAWSEGKRSGNGTCIHVSEGWTHEGGWKEDKPDGDGVRTFQRPDRHRREIKHTGSWSLGHRHGYGKTLLRTEGLDDPAVLRMRWFMGKPTFPATYFAKDHSVVYVGGWDASSNTPNGWGISFNANSVYYGEWNDASRHGKGTMLMMEDPRMVLSGKWANSDFHGEGMIELPSVGFLVGKYSGGVSRNHIQLSSASLMIGSTRSNAVQALRGSSNGVYEQAMHMNRWALFISKMLSEVEVAGKAKEAETLLHRSMRVSKHDSSVVSRVLSILGMAEHPLGRASLHFCKSFQCIANLIALYLRSDKEQREARQFGVRNGPLPVGELWTLLCSDWHLFFSAMRSAMKSRLRISSRRRVRRQQVPASGGAVEGDEAARSGLEDSGGLGEDVGDGYSDGDGVGVGAAADGEGGDAGEDIASGSSIDASTPPEPDSPQPATVNMSELSDLVCYRALQQSAVGEKPKVFASLWSLCCLRNEAADMRVHQRCRRLRRDWSTRQCLLLLLGKEKLVHTLMCLAQGQSSGARGAQSPEASAVSVEGTRSRGDADAVLPTSVGLTPVPLDDDSLHDFQDGEAKPFAQSSIQLRRLVRERVPWRMLKSVKGWFTAAEDFLSALSGDAVFGADELVPTLMYSMVHSHVTCLASFVEYIETFLDGYHDNRLHEDGRLSYIWVTFKACVSALEGLDLDSLAQQLQDDDDNAVKG